MALQSQGVVIRRESSAAGSTAVLSATNTISFDSTNKYIMRQAGFGDFVTDMRIRINGSASNDGAYTITATAATRLTVAENLNAEASGGNVAIDGHLMQEIGQITAFNGPNITASPIDITNLRSTAKEKIMALNDPGDLQLSLVWENEVSYAHLHDALQRDMVARTLRWFEVRYTDTGTSLPSADLFEGYISGFTYGGAVDNVIRGDVSIAISGPHNYATAV